MNMHCRAVLGSLLSVGFGRVGSFHIRLFGVSLVGSCKVQSIES